MIYISHKVPKLAPASRGLKSTLKAIWPNHKNTEKSTTHIIPNMVPKAIIAMQQNRALIGSHNGANQLPCYKNSVNKGHKKTCDPGDNADIVTQKID